MNKETQQDFKCPQCGGEYFGRDTARDKDGRVITLDTVRCHSDTEGQHIEATPDGLMARKQAGLPRQKPCGWHGKWP